MIAEGFKFAEKMRLTESLKGTFKWLEVESKKGPLCILTIKGDWSKNCNRHLLELNEFYDELVESGYRVYGLSNQCLDKLILIQQSLLLKFELVSCPDDSLPNEMKSKYNIDLFLTTRSSSDYSQGCILEPCLFALKNDKIIFSWSTNTNVKSPPRTSIRPKIIRLLKIAKGASYQQDHPTPVKDEQPFFHFSIDETEIKFAACTFNFALCLLPSQQSSDDLQCKTIT